MLRKLGLALAALALLSAPAAAQTYSRSQTGAVGSLVTATDTSGASVKVVLPQVTLAGSSTSGSLSIDSVGRASVIGGQTNGSSPVSGASGLLVGGSDTSTYRHLLTDTNGAVIVRGWAQAGSTWGYAAAASGIVNTTTAVTIKTAAGAGVRNYVNSCQIATDTLGGETELAIRDGAAGTVLWRTKLQTGPLNPLTVSFGSPLRGTANTLLEVVTLTAVTGGVYVSCQGFTGS